MTITEFKEFYSNVNDPKTIKTECLSRVKPKIVNKNLCKEILANKVSRDFLDLAIYYYIEFEAYSIIKSVLVTTELADWLGVTEENLYTAAINNIKGDEVIQKLGNVLEMLGVDTEEKIGKELSVLVISNKNGINGAAQILNPDTMEQLSKKIGSCYLIPSSIHEWLAVPLDVVSYNQLNTTINEVNQTILKKEEILSDHCYFYDASLREVMLPL